MSSNKLGVRFGYLPDSHDKSKDFLYKVKLAHELKAEIPLEKDLSARPQPAMMDQGNVGSCVSNSIKAVLGYDSAKAGYGVIEYSRLFNYWLAREHKAIDEGCTLRDACNAIRRKGICLETLWPYDERRWAEMPPNPAWGEAWHRIATLTYYRLLNLNEMKNCIAQNFPFIFGVDVYESFIWPGPDLQGNVPMPNMSREQLLGGHAMAAFGYSDSRQAVLIRNSWGTGWGKNGWAWLPYDYLTHPWLIYDAWTLRRLAP